MTAGKNSRELARFALLVALAMVLSWLESLVPLSLTVPGVKLGLANLVVIFALYKLGPRQAAVISLVRVLLITFTFGNAFSFAYSLTGAALSFVVMLLLKKTGKFSLLGVSIAGGVCHNIGQILVAMAVLGTAELVWYLPALLIAGTVAGICIGAAGALVTARVKL